MNLNPLSWFSKAPDGPVWTVDEADVKPEFTEVASTGETVEVPNPTTGLWGYRVTFRKGRQEIETLFRFPTAKPIQKVLALARKEC